MKDKKDKGENKKETERVGIIGGRGEIFIYELGGDIFKSQHCNDSCEKRLEKDEERSEQAV